jgi:hypothetical protein
MNAPVALTPELLTQLTAIVGENRIKTDADSLENWGRDHTKHFDPNPSVIVFPSSTEQVQAIVNLPINLMLRLHHQVVAQVYRQVQLRPMVKL